VPEAVLQGLTHLPQLGFGADLGQGLVDVQALLGARDVVLRQQVGEAQLQLAVRLHRQHGLLALQAGDGLLHHVREQFQAHLGDVPGLLAAQQVARPADLQVVRGDLEAGAQVVQLLQQREALLGYVRKHLLRRDQQVGIGLVM